VGSAYFYNPSQNPNAISRNVADAQRMRQQSLASQRDQNERWQRRNGLDIELKKATHHAHRHQKDLERILHDLFHHPMKVDEDIVDGGSKLDTYLQTVVKASHNAHVEVHTTTQQHTSYPGGDHGATMNPGDSGSPEAQLFQILAMCFVLIRRIALSSRSRRAHDRARQHASEIKRTVDHLGSTARRAR
jgi:hypothetical protein